MYQEYIFKTFELQKRELLKKENWICTNLQNKFIYEFQPVIYDIIKTQLENIPVQQGDLKYIFTYINYIKYLYSQINLYMVEEEIFSYILKKFKKRHFTINFHA